MANLLVHIESLAWDSLAIDRSKELNDLALAVHLIKRKDDVIYSHPDTFALSLRWGFLYELLTFDDQQKGLHCPWLTHDHQKTLVKLFSHSVSKRPSYNLKHLHEEFSLGLNAMLGIDTQIQEKYVYDDKTLEALHESANTIQPIVFNLTISGNEINALIDRKQTHDCFKRLDMPKQIEEGRMLHGEQIQMHFNDADKSCLNIDGTWKHGSYKIPKDAAEILKSWGFSVPAS